MLKLDSTAVITKLSAHKFNAEVLNQTKSIYKKDRQRSKTVTFALQYGSSAGGLVKNAGFSYEEAQEIYNSYHELYKVSDEYKDAQCKQAEKTGYVTCAFGLRLRTPKIKQSLIDLKVTPHEVSAEKRTAGNALMQSWGLLNTRAGIEVNSTIRNSKYKYSVRPVCQIHDAQYFLIKDDIDLLVWFNDLIVKACEWQEDPVIAHPTVHLGGELSIFYPSWAHELVIPNHATQKDIRNLVNNYLKSL